jgi:hypothetical protein
MLNYRNNLLIILSVYIITLDLTKAEPQQMQCDSVFKVPKEDSYDVKNCSLDDKRLNCTSYIPIKSKAKTIVSKI